MGYIFWLASQTVSFLLYVWPVTVALALLFLVSLVATSKRHGLSLRALIALSPLIFPCLILFWGGVFEYHDSGGPDWAIKALYAFLAGTALTAVVVTVRLAPYRWLAASLGALSVWVSFAAAFVAGMSISGTWL